MPDTASQTAIVNMALTMLGEGTRISAMDDGSRLARHANAVWDLARDEALEGHPWNFAVGRQSLPVSADYVPPSQYDFAYELPADCLRWLPPSEDDSDYFAGELESGLVTSGSIEVPRRFIVSNASAPIVIRYIRRVEAIAIWSASFRVAMAAKVAKYLAKPITGQSNMMEAMEAEYEAAIAAARARDGLATGRTQRRQAARSSWLDARRRGTGT